MYRAYTTYRDEGDGIFSVRVHETNGDCSVMQMSACMLDMQLRALASEGFPVMRAA